MKKSQIAILVVGVVLIAVLYMSHKSAASKQVSSSNSNQAFFSGVGSFLGGIAGSFKASAPVSTGSPPPVYNPAVGYVQPGADTTAYGTNPDYNPVQGDYGPYLPSSSTPSS